MEYSALLAVLALLLSAEASVGPSTSSSFCTESKECLEYELICKTDEYEVRHYSPTRWISTDAETFLMGVGAAMAFRRLFQYITGANQGEIQMDMTPPVLVKIPAESRAWEPAIYTLSFPLPAAYQENPPAPTNDKVYFTEMPHMDVYVRSYGGWMLSIDSRSHTHLLTTELDRVRASYNHSYHYGVGYDSPLKLLNRHNEVWYVVNGQPVCTDPQEPTPAHTTRATPTEQAAASPSPQMLADSPYSSSSNTSWNSTSNSSSPLPTDPPTVVPSASAAASGHPSSLPLSFSSSPPAASQVPTVAVTNSSDPAAESPPSELQPDAEVWNSTAPEQSATATTAAADAA